VAIKKLRTTLIQQFKYKRGIYQMAEDTYPMTAEGRDKLKAELEDLKVNQRPKVVERIKIARSYGDLSENSEYESAKDEQSMLESRITTIEHMLQYAQIIDSHDSDKDEVTVGKKVTFKELPDEDPETYQIVGAAEADPLSGKISNDSPIAKGLIGHRLNEEVNIPIPAGTMKVKITKVE
jgi:transcription elongation factor GreA